MQLLMLRLRCACVQACRYRCLWAAAGAGKSAESCSCPQAELQVEAKKRQAAKKAWAEAVAGAKQQAAQHEERDKETAAAQALQRAWRERKLAQAQAQQALVRHPRSAALARLCRLALRLPHTCCLGPCGCLVCRPCPPSLCYAMLQLVRLSERICFCTRCKVQAIQKRTLVHKGLLSWAVPRCQPRASCGADGQGARAGAEQRAQRS